MEASTRQELIDKLPKCYKSQVSNTMPERVIRSLGGDKEGYMEPTTLRRIYPKLQSFFKEAYPDLLMKHGRPISQADLDLLCGKVLVAVRGVWDQYARGHVTSQVSTLAICSLLKSEVLKVAKGALPIQCVIMPSSEVNYSVPTPLCKDEDDHFVLRLEVDDPDDPVNNPSMFFVIPKAQDDFFGAPSLDGRLQCDIWMFELSGDFGNEQPSVQPSVLIRSECLGAGRPILPSDHGRHSRAVAEDKLARDGICFVCGKGSGRENVKRCQGCKRVAYCSRVCQKADWKEHKPGCNMTLQKIQREDF